MNKKLILASLLSLGLAASPVAMAKPDKHQGRGPDREHHYDRGDHHAHRDNGWHGERERRWQGDRYHITVYQPPRGYVQHHWRYGDRVPTAYRNHRYVVNDYRVYQLAPPPRGHQWLRVDNDVVLTAITTGVIAAVVYDIFQQ